MPFTDEAALGKVKQENGLLHSEGHFDADDSPRTGRASDFKLV